MQIYNTLSRKLETFESISPKHVGIYVCGPTVYGPPHLGHVRGPIVFDVLRRYLILQGYKVRFVRNITDVGHLVGDADEGEDKLVQQAKVEQLEPMEVAQAYTDAYNSVMDRMKSGLISSFNCTPHAQTFTIGKVNFIARRVSENLNGVLGLYLVEKRDTVFYFIAVKREVTWHNLLL